MKKDNPAQVVTDDTTLEDEYEIQRLDALPQRLQDLAALHALDQFNAVPPYIGRYQSPQSGEERTYV